MQQRQEAPQRHRVRATRGSSARGMQERDAGPSRRGTDASRSTGQRGDGFPFAGRALWRQGGGPGNDIC
eukprot:1991632-Pyramimonas_sp.AAC.2